MEDDGRVLSWGYGGHGQLGHFSTQNQAVPTVNESLASEKVVYIACGGSSSAAVTGKICWLLSHSLLFLAIQICFVYIIYYYTK